MICQQCHADKPEDDMHQEGLCDDCFIENLEQQEADIDIDIMQNHKCWLCGQESGGWICKDLPDGRHMVCWPSCENKLPPPIRLTAADFKKHL